MAGSPDRLTSNGYALDRSPSRLGELRPVPDAIRGNRDALWERLRADGYLATGIGNATQAHYDLVYLREGTDRVLSSWIPLGDCPVSLGGLIYLERSHHRVLAEEAAGTLRRPAASITADLPALADEWDARWLLADYAAGDMMIHSAHLVHASLDNVDTGGRMRLSTDIRYQRADQPIDWRWQRHWHLDDFPEEESAPDTPAG